jgi:hypothetical protein
MLKGLNIATVAADLTLGLVLSATVFKERDDKLLEE